MPRQHQQQPTKHTRTRTHAVLLVPRSRTHPPMTPPILATPNKKPKTRLTASSVALLEPPAVHHDHGTVPLGAHRSLVLRTGGRLLHQNTHKNSHAAKHADRFIINTFKSTLHRHETYLYVTGTARDTCARYVVCLF